MIDHLGASGNYWIVTGAELPPRFTNSDAASDYQLRSSRARAAIRGSCAAYYASSIDNHKELRSRLAERLDSTYSAKPPTAIYCSTTNQRTTLSQLTFLLYDIRSQFVRSPQAIDDDSFKNQLLSCLPSTYDVLQKSSMKKKRILRSKKLFARFNKKIPHYRLQLHQRKPRWFQE